MPHAGSSGADRTKLVEITVKDNVKGMFMLSIFLFSDPKCLYKYLDIAVALNCEYITIQYVVSQNE